MAEDENSTFDILKGWKPLEAYETAAYGAHPSTGDPYWVGAISGRSTAKTIAVTDRAVADEINKLVAAVNSRPASPPVHIDLASVGGLDVSVWVLAIAIAIHAIVLLVR